MYTCPSSTILPSNPPLWSDVLAWQDSSNPCRAVGFQNLEPHFASRDFPKFNCVVFVVSGIVPPPIALHTRSRTKLVAPALYALTLTRSSPWSCLIHVSSTCKRLTTFGLILFSVFLFSRGNRSVIFLFQTCTHSHTHSSVVASRTSIRKKVPKTCQSLHVRDELGSEHPTTYRLLIVQ